MVDFDDDCCFEDESYDFEQVLAFVVQSCQSYRADANIAYDMPAAPSPPMFVIRAREPSVDYNKAGMSSVTADWYFVIEYFHPVTSSETAQAEMGAIVSPGSPLMRALNDTEIPGGWVRAKQATIARTRSGGTVLGYARILVDVRA